jgi:Aldo/keto reductases, related to diketogulonate reductase
MMKIKMFFISQEGDTLFPADANGKTLYSDANYVDTWLEMEKLVADGLVKSIGVSNFNSKQIQDILDKGTIKPVVNQVTGFSLKVYI